MKQEITQLLEAALQALTAAGTLPAPTDASKTPAIRVDASRDKDHGDYASNVAMSLAKQAGMKPRDLAQLIADAVQAADNGKTVEKIEIAGPGFINFFLASGSAHAIVNTILGSGAGFGLRELDAKDAKRIQVEFVSVNPTGPLHVGHGRGAVYGDALANLLQAAGHDVQREYYVNDAGRQMDILALSVWLRYLQLSEEPGEGGGGHALAFPSNGYQGDYIIEIAKSLHARHGTKFNTDTTALFKDIVADEPQGGDKEKHIDALIGRAKSILGGDYGVVFDQAMDAILGEIREDLQEFGIRFDNWFSERSLTEGSPSNLEQALGVLRDKKLIEIENGAQWFRATQFGDDKDRVVVRDNGDSTYFASDIAYHWNKFQRGFDEVINVWGADHHGYIARVHAALEALGLDKNKLLIRLVQLVYLYRGKEKVSMSTRKGEFVTLRELREEVGSDAARYFYLMRRSEQPTDFDLELAKSQSKDNPVYYIQYAHARVCSLFDKLAESGLGWDKNGEFKLDLLSEPQEDVLIRRLTAYPETLLKAAESHEPHQLCNYLRELAGEFHTWYNAHRTIVDDAGLRDARLALSVAVRQVLANGLQVLGISAPESM